VKLERLVPAELNDEMREAIKSLIFSEWLTDQRTKALIKVPLLEAAENESNTETDEMAVE
jgi:hypothetical protein